MKQGKDTRSKEAPNRDPQVDNFSYDEFFQNRLSLPKDLKDSLRAQGLDWRFINSAQFRKDGNVHRSHWKPHKFTDQPDLVNVDGFIFRGDLVLATRATQISKAEKKFIQNRNDIQSGFNRIEAQKLRQMAKEAGLGSSMKVYDGYEENDTN